MAQEEDSSTSSMMNLAGFQALDLVCARRARLDKYERQASLRSTPGALEVLSQARQKHYGLKQEPIRLGKLETQRESTGRRAHRPTDDIDKEIEEQMKHLMSRVGELSSGTVEDEDVQGEDAVDAALAERESSYRRNLFLQNLASRVAAGSNGATTPGPSSSTKLSMPAITKPSKVTDLATPQHGDSDSEQQLSEPLPILPAIVGPASRTSLSGTGAGSPTRQLLHSSSLASASRNGRISLSGSCSSAVKQKPNLDFRDEWQLEPGVRPSASNRSMRQLPALESLMQDAQPLTRQRFSEAGGSYASQDRPSGSLARLNLGNLSPGGMPGAPRSRGPSLSGMPTSPLMESLLRAAGTGSSAGAAQPRNLATPTARPGSVAQGPGSGNGSRSSRVGAYLDFMSSEEASKPVQLIQR